MHSIDLFVQNYLVLARTAGVTTYMILLTTFFDFSIYFILLALCIAVLVYFVRGFKYAALFICSLLFGACVVYILKIYFGIARPLDSILYAYGDSFPSWHATVSTIFFGMLMYIFDRYFRPHGRIIFNSLCILCVCGIAFSRLYLGEHWLSDVLAGIALGSLISYISVLVFRRVCRYIYRTS
ncbi:MAG: phosphatase PAP2 family protein [Patescibacteria group bacterium]